MRGASFRLAVIQMAVPHRADADVIAEVRTDIERLTRAITTEAVTYSVRKRQGDTAENVQRHEAAREHMFRCALVVEGELPREKL